MKNFIIIGSFIFLFGLIIFVLALTFSRWDFSKISTRQYEEKQYTVQNNNQTISIKDSNMPFSIGLSSDDQIHFIYYETEKEFYKIDESSGIKVEKKWEYKWYDYIFNLNFQRLSFTVLLPTDFNGSLDIKTNNGRISVSDIKANQLTLFTNNGTITLRDVSSSDKLILSTSNGKIELSDINAGSDIRCTTNNGRISVSDTSTALELKCATTNGSVYLDKISSQDIDADTSNGKITAIRTYTTQNTILKTSNGQIQIQNLRSDKDIDLNTSNGKISGNIIGNENDFSITSKTSNAKNNLSEHKGGGNKSLNVKTTNGSIAIDFTN